MAVISAFDVLGPNMIGPSSSHTAGAVAIALLAQKNDSRTDYRGRVYLVRFLFPGLTADTARTGRCWGESWDLRQMTGGSAIPFPSPRNGDCGIPS